MTHTQCSRANLFARFANLFARFANLFARTLAVVSIAAAPFVIARPAAAVPIFAERFRFRCTQCHTAVPELNAFGEHFRRAGYQLPNVPKHYEFPLALRFQETYVKDLPPSQTRHFTGLGILVSTANFGSNGEMSYFARYLLGSQGAAGSLYYAWLQHVDPKTGVFEQGGLFQLPLIANPTQRLDTITAPPVYTYVVGHSVANLSTPRWGALFGKRDDRVDAEAAFSINEYKGAAYGAPVPLGFVQSFGRPEAFVNLTVAAGQRFRVGGLYLNGERSIRAQSSSLAFADEYSREGVQASWTGGRFEVVGQQVWGQDSNIDGFGSRAASSGGFLTLKYRPTAHAYLGARYDAAANPFASRDWVFYGAFQPTIHARFVVEHLRPLGTGGTGSVTSAQLLLVLPFQEWFGAPK